MIVVSDNPNKRRQRAAGSVGNEGKKILKVDELLRDVAHGHPPDMGVMIANRSWSASFFSTLSKISLTA